MKEHMDTTRRQLGELGAMAAQNEAMERKILARAEERLADVQGQLDGARASAMSGDDVAKQTYLDMVEEQGRLQQVIAQAKAVLA